MCKSKKAPIVKEEYPVLKELDAIICKVESDPFFQTELGFAKAQEYVTYLKNLRNHIKEQLDNYDNMFVRIIPGMYFPMC